MSTKYLIDAPEGETIDKVVFSEGAAATFTHPAVSVEIDYGDEVLLLRDADGDYSGIIQAEDLDNFIEAVNILKANINQ